MSPGPEKRKKTPRRWVSPRIPSVNKIKLSLCISDWGGWVTVYYIYKCHGIKKGWGIKGSAACIQTRTSKGYAKYSTRIKACTHGVILNSPCICTIVYALAPVHLSIIVFCELCSSVLFPAIISAYLALKECINMLCLWLPSPTIHNLHPFLSVCLSVCTLTHL